MYGTLCMKELRHLGRSKEFSHHYSFLAIVF